MIIAPRTSVHRGAAVSDAHAQYHAAPANADQSFGRKVESFRRNNMLAMPPFSMTGQSLKTIANIYRHTAPNGAPLHFQLFGKPATLGKVGDNLVFRGKYSANPAEPSGMIMFKNGKINFAQSGYPGRNLTPKQQAFMVQALVDKMSQRILNHHA